MGNKSNKVKSNNDDEEKKEEKNLKINKRPKDDISDDDEKKHDEFQFVIDGIDFGLGCFPDEDDERDIFELFDETQTLFVSEDNDNTEIQDNLSLVDLTENVSIPIYNQGPMNSCVANGLAYIFEYNAFKLKLEDDENNWTPSRLYIWYNAKPENMKDKNGSVSVRTAIKTMRKSTFGVCSEKLWPYDVTKYTIKPKTECYEIGKDNFIISYKRLKRHIYHFKAALCDGYPIVFGFYVFPSSMQSFSDKKDERKGNIDMPSVDEINKFVKNKKTPGGHAMVLVGYDEEKQVFKARNSWGTDSGDQGYCYFPYDFMLHKFTLYNVNGKVYKNVALCYNFWIIKEIEIQ